MIAELVRIIIKKPSKLALLSCHYITITMTKTRTRYWVTLVKSGTLPFDALFYCQDPVKERYKMALVDQVSDIVGAKNLANGAKLILWLYLYIMIRGQAPSKSSLIILVVPKFLSSTLHIAGTVTKIVKKISTTNISNFNVS